MGEFIQCNKCVLDTTVSDINFDEHGVCNYCYNFQRLAEITIFRPIEQRTRELNVMIDRIKKAGLNKPYDCLLGVSGGVDSSFLAYKAKEWGLRPLIVHFDNGWNSELAVKNIETILKKLQFDFRTYVMDWEEFKDIQLSYLRSSVVDIEVPTDHFIFGSLYRIAAKNNIQYILSGANISTEGINPRPWIFSPKTDLVNLRAIHRKFGSGRIRKLPLLGRYHKYFFEKVFAIKTIDLLNYIPYKKEEVKEKLKTELGWRDYGGKHYESVYTRFYQGYILPGKFNIDKRKAHLSNLICTGQISKEEALQELSLPTYSDVEQMQDKAFVAKKLGIGEEEFHQIMQAPRADQYSFGSEYSSSFEAKFRLFRYLMFIPVFLLSPIIRIVYRIK